MTFVLMRVLSLLRVIEILLDVQSILLIIIIIEGLSLLQSILVLANVLLCFVTGWRHALRCERPFIMIIMIIITIFPGFVFALFVLVPVPEHL